MWPSSMLDKYYPFACFSTRNKALYAYQNLQIWQRCACHNKSRLYNNTKMETVLYVAGIYCLSRLSFKVLSNLHAIFKAFCLPLFWPRNFVQEYGKWAIGKFVIQRNSGFKPRNQCIKTF